MDLDMGTLAAGLVIGGIGTGVFLYGKKAGDIRCLAAGLLLGIEPMFVHPAWAVWLAGLATLAALVAWCRAYPV